MLTDHRARKWPAAPVGTGNLIHLARPGDIRWSCHRREPVFVRGTGRDRPDRV